jgi:hypothetical protein
MAQCYFTRDVFTGAKQLQAEATESTARLGHELGMALLLLFWICIRRRCARLRMALVYPAQSIDDKSNTSL